MPTGGPVRGAAQPLTFDRARPSPRQHPSPRHSPALRPAARGRRS